MSQTPQPEPATPQPKLHTLGFPPSLPQSRYQLFGNGPQNAMEQSLEILMLALSESIQPHKGPLTVADLHHHQQRVHTAMMQAIVIYRSTKPR